jgi:predicted anti-sigma-YlaC factor YlaD
MNCEQVRQYLVAALDHPGDGSIPLEPRLHLGDCPACSAFHREQTRLTELLAAVGDPAHAPSLPWERFESRLPNSRAAKWSLSSFLDAFSLSGFRFAVVASLVLLLASLALLHFDSIGASDGQTLAALRTYQIEAAGNPFMPAVSPQNPFFTIEPLTEENPFDGVESAR